MDKQVIRNPNEIDDLVRIRHWLSGRLHAELYLHRMPSSTPEDDGWISLFNGKNLDGWYTYLESSGKNSDPKGIFKVENGMIHILDVPMSDGKSDNGYLSTTQDFSDVRIHIEYKWGTKRSSEGKRNSGLLYLAVGPDAIYPTSLECQIEETDVGDCGYVNGASVTAFFIAPAVRCMTTICRLALA